MATDPGVPVTSIFLPARDFRLLEAAAEALNSGREIDLCAVSRLPPLRASEKVTRRVIITISAGTSDRSMKLVQARCHAWQGLY
jgi:hypothetical protein